jgi:hypothetical protein
MGILAIDCEICRQTGRECQISDCVIGLRKKKCEKCNRRLDICIKNGCIDVNNLNSSFSRRFWSRLTSFINSRNNVVIQGNRNNNIRPNINISSRNNNTILIPRTYEIIYSTVDCFGNSMNIDNAVCLAQYPTTTFGRIRRMERVINIIRVFVNWFETDGDPLLTDDLPVDSLRLKVLD